MKLLKTFISIIVLSLVIVSCRKDESIVTAVACSDGLDSVIQTTEFYGTSSSEYLAAFPGSWRVLSNGDTLSCKMDELIGIVESHVDSANCEEHFEESIFYGAVINGPSSNDFTKGFIDGDFRVIRDYSSGELKWEEIIRTSYIEEGITSEWIVSYKSGSDDSGHPWSYTFKKNLINYHDLYELPNGDVYENVAEIRQELEVDNKIGGYSLFDTLYYAHEIGLIRYVNPDDPIDGPGGDYYVVDYYIAPH